MAHKGFNFEAFMNASLFDHELRQIYVLPEVSEADKVSLVKTRMKAIAGSLGADPAASPEVFAFVDSLDVKALIAMARQFNTGDSNDNTVGT